MVRCIVVAEEPRLRPGQYYDFVRRPDVRAAIVAKKMRLDPPRHTATAEWCVRELLYHATAQNDDLADAVLIVTLAGGLGGFVRHTVSTPCPGRRLIRLLFDWDDITPSLGLRPRALSDQVLAAMTTPGGVLRAQVRHARNMGS